MVGGTVDFYVRDFPGLVRLSVAAARAFRSPALMAGAEEARFFVDLEALVGVPGSAEVTVEELLDESGEGEEMFSGTVLESCRYEISETSCHARPALKSAPQRSSPRSFSAPRSRPRITCIQWWRNGLRFSSLRRAK